MYARALTVLLKSHFFGNLRHYARADGLLQNYGAGFDFTYPSYILTRITKGMSANFAVKSSTIKPKTMLTNHDVARAVDTVLIIPGMYESVKIDLKLSLKNVLLLNQVISRGLASEPDEKTNNLLAGIPEENL